MKKLHVIFLLNFLIYVSFLAKGQGDKVVYADSTVSKMVITKMFNDSGPADYSIIATSYSIEYLFIKGEINLIAVKKTSQLIGSQLTDELYYHHLVSADFIPLNNKNLKPFSMNYNCNDIILHRDFYETTTDGCCGGANVITYYSYLDQKKICEGDEGIRSYAISNINCYIGFTTRHHSLYPDTVSTLYIYYSTGESYKIKLVDSLHHFYPSLIRIVTGNPKDQIYDGYEGTSIIYSLGEIGSVSQINNLKISLIDTWHKSLTIDIPIINGKPFGKDEAEQTLKVPKTE